ncbi:MAG TPA: carboxylating nicotinate-nucleotide diphosphorylase [Thermoleophilaceae bacterium]|nr:carboxylating nicotinate-nucleotide diphosphorylase [Thermoleophilaceae bacterium]
MQEVIDRALAEDVGAGDVTTESLVPAGARARARIVQKSPGVLAGLRVAEAVFRRVDPELRWHAHAPEGEWRDGGLVAEVAGSAGAILRGERVALNFLGRLSGIATLTARYVRAVEGTGARILDTRKTTPGLRALEKRAVTVGGGANHRFGLFDAVLIKENHVAAAGGIRAAVEGALAGAPPGMMVEVECRTLDEVDEAVAAGAPRLLLDNMGTEEMSEAVRRVAGRAELEASGGVSLDTVRAIAETGVDYISVGALTHSAPALDLSLQLESL